LPALIALGATAVLAACGVEKTLDPVAAAATKSEQAGGAKLAMTMTLTAGGSSYTVSADGVFDQTEADMTMDMSGLEQAGLPAGLLDNLEVRYLQENGDPVMYMNLPFLASRLPSGKSWVRVDLEQVGEGLGVDLDKLLSQSSQNPAQMLDLLRASGDVQEVGTDTVDGVSTTEYKGSIDLTQAAKLEGLSRQAQQLIDDGAPSSIPVEAWIGDDGLVRKLELTEDTTNDGRPVSADITIAISDYGTDVSVTAPPAEQVFDVSSLLAQAAQSIGSGTTTTSSSAGTTTSG
jgi:hypothetical protein